MNKIKEIINDNANVLLFFSVINPLFWVAVTLCVIVFAIAFILAFVLFKVFAIHDAWNYFVKIPRMDTKELKRTLSFIEAVNPKSIKQKFLKRIFVKKINRLLKR